MKAYKESAHKEMDQSVASNADFMSQYVKKGALLGVEGRIQTRSYDDKNGKRVYVTDCCGACTVLGEQEKECE